MKKCIETKRISERKYMHIDRICLVFAQLTTGLSGICALIFMLAC